ncbi:MAG: hypothetical protein Q4B22_12095, partial [Eubacteriales bacterium]|nr:hypothetical protein [Eubacteriales bacterium]
MAEYLKLSSDSKLEEIFSYEESAAVFDRILPGMRAMLEQNKAGLRYSVRKLAEFSRGAVSETAIDRLDAELKLLRIVRENSAEYTEMQPLTACASAQIIPERQTAIYPGKPWYDTEGKRIQTHGGAVFYENGIYYWYGENKDRTDGKCAVWTWGIRAYASEDLYNWKDLGLIIHPDLKNPDSGLYPEKHVDRPHILKSRTTGKYVCWIKQSGEEACFLILEADAFTGPYTLVKENYRPFGHAVGDFDLIQKEENTYLFMDADHKGILGLRISDDLHDAAEEISMQY